MFAHVGDEGYVESCAADLTRYRRQLDAQHVLIFTDVKKKHRHAAARPRITFTHAYNISLYMYTSLLLHENQRQEFVSVKGGGPQNLAQFVCLP